MTVLLIMNSFIKSENLNKLKKILKEYETENEIPPINVILTSQKFVKSQDSQQFIRFIKSMKQENKDLNSKNQILQETLRISQEKNAEILEAHSLEKLKFEGIITRNLTMIENLLKDKQNINEEIEKLLREKNELEHKNQETLNFFREKLRNELKIQKENSENLEKQRRKQWYSEKTKEIKEITVRGLEPELSKIIEKHKRELKNVDEKFQQEIQSEKMLKRNFGKALEEEIKKKEMYWENEKQRICNRFEMELEQKEMQRKIEAENFQLKMRLFQKME